MSIEAQFSTMRYPSLRSTAQGERDDTARAGGYAAGYAAGLRAAEAEVAARIAALEAERAAEAVHASARIDRAVSLLALAAQALDDRTVPVLAEAQAAIEHGALQLAEALVGSEFGEAGSAARSAVHRALSGVDTALVQTVRMNPVDLQTLASLDLVPSGVDFTADPRLARGDAVTEFADGYLDARISAALVRAHAALEEARP
jgi:flagellar assembly protein FliH